MIRAAYSGTSINYLMNRYDTPSSLSLPSNEPISCSSSSVGRIFSMAYNVVKVMNLPPLHYNNVFLKSPLGIFNLVRMISIFLDLSGRNSWTIYFNEGGRDIWLDRMSLPSVTSNEETLFKLPDNCGVVFAKSSTS